MKIRDVLEIYQYISVLKLNKFDKEIRLKLIKNYPLLEKVVKDYNDYRDSLQNKMFENVEEDVIKLQKIRSKINKNLTKDEIDKISMELQQYEDVLDLEVEFAKLINEKLEESVCLQLVTIDKNEFIENLVNAGVDFTFKDLLKLNAILI